MKIYNMYVGCYSKTKGIYHFKVNALSGEVNYIGQYEGHNPSYLTVSQNGRYLYSVYENEDGGLAAYEIIKDGRLLLKNMRSSHGKYPCHVAADSANNWLFCANYGDGSITGYGLTQNGSLGDLLNHFRHTGSSINTDRQSSAHAHQVCFTPDGKYLCAVDLGIDKVLVYPLNPTEVIVSDFQAAIEVPPGYGPRHMVFSRDGRYAFLICELVSCIISYKYCNGNFNQMGIASTLPADWCGNSYCAAIHIHPDGKTILASNRGHDSIAVLSFSDEEGHLSLLKTIPCAGKTPRDFGIAPESSYLFCANQADGTVTCIDISGKAQTSVAASVPGAACITFCPEST